MFAGRLKELSRIKAELKPGRNASILVFGRRRLGKSSLIREALKDFSGKVIHYHAVPDEEAYNVRRLCCLTASVLASKCAGIRYFDGYLRYISDRNEDIALVLDDYENMRGGDDRHATLIDSCLRDFIGRKGCNIKLIVAGSDTGRMSDCIYDRGSTLFRCFSAVLELDEMDYLEASAFYPHLSALDKIKYYAIFGGIPQILSHIDESKGIEWNIRSQFMKEGGAARCYIGLVFDRELREINNGYAVARRIGHGCVRYSEIEKILDDGKIKRQLVKVLFDLARAGIIRKRNPISSPEDRKKSTYGIRSNLLRFWFRYMDTADTPAWYGDGVVPDLDEHIRQGFPEIVMQYLRRLDRNDIMSIGTYWKDSPANQYAALEIPLGCFELFKPIYGEAPLALDSMTRICDSGAGAGPGVRIVSAAGFLPEKGEPYGISGEDMYSLFNGEPSCRKEDRMDISTALAHRDKDTGREQLLIDHLHSTAELAASFASHFGCADNAYAAGLYHDLGKCTEGFARRLEGGPPVDHATMGAYALLREKRFLEAIAVASHHTGLQDMGVGDKYEGSTFSSRIRNFAGLEELRKCEEQLDPLQPEPKDSINSDIRHIRSLEWFIAEHFLFSSLVDADYTDTGRFEGMLPGESSDYDFGAICRAILAKADGYLGSASGKDPAERRINELRNAMLKECLQKAERPQGIYALTMPTGSGKTFASLAFAARHALHNRNIRRIIYVIPYLSIIEQNADVIRSVVGSGNVLEHHSVSPVFTADAKTDEVTRLQLAAENWDIPVVVTTNEQFFESLFSSKARKCRKIHNISDSIIIFDEAQMLPLKYLKLFMAAVEELACSGRYGVTALFCTATQPSLGRFLRHGEPEEIVDPSLAEDPAFRRNRVMDICREKGLDGVCRLSASYDQALIIVNRKKDAATIYEQLPPEGRFYLTTNLTPHSRRRIIKAIRKRLEDGQACHVVSTSLIEAGVDVDFPVVFREKNGLDSIVQAGGRCNRNGRRSSEDSIVYVFDSGNMPNYADYSQKIYAYGETARAYDDIFSPEAVRKYYSLYYPLTSTDKGMRLLPARADRIPFEEISRSIRIIDEDDIGVFIRQDEEAERIYQEILDNGISIDIMRRAAEYTVRCPRYAAEELIRRGEITIIKDDFALQNNNIKYNEYTGLDYSNQGDSEALFF